MRTPQGRRHFTFLRGRNAERLALLLLMVKGYRPVARRFSAAGGEIDLIVRRGGTLAFVEVKVRADMDQAQRAIDAGKRRRISRAARVWMARNPWSSEMVLRADAVFLAPGAWPVHLVDAFEIEA